jgi:hypothetical protein
MLIGVNGSSIDFINGKLQTQGLIESKWRNLEVVDISQFAFHYSRGI